VNGAIPVTFIRGRRAREVRSTARVPKPEWLKVRAPGSAGYLRLKAVMRELGLHTVCEEANCPNIGECWHHGTATFMILGDICTRACAYCAVAHGRPTELDLDEPRRVAEAVKAMGLKYAVVTFGCRVNQADSLGFAVPLELASADGDLRLITTITSFATAADVTLAELHLEAFLPADDRTAEVLRRRWG